MAFSIAVLAVGPNIACFPPTDLTTTCSIAGSDTACGKCVTSRCDTPINACCTDDSFGLCGESELADLELCTTKKDCDDLLELCRDGTSTSGDDELAKCVVEKCSSQCGVAPRACERTPVSSFEN